MTRRLHHNMEKLMKQSITLFGLLWMIAISAPIHAQATEHNMEEMNHHMMMQSKDGVSDKRISLQLNPQQKQHQLANMRSHVQAVQEIIGMLSQGKFNHASTIAHNKLGLTPEMKKMCNMFDNANFRKVGLAFHQSADELGDVLKKGSLKQSLRALHNTMNYCVQCHATYRQ